jgi:hypothetical protein
MPRHDPQTARQDFELCLVLRCVSREAVAIGSRSFMMALDAKRMHVKGTVRHAADRGWDDFARDEQLFADRHHAKFVC